MRTFFMAAAIVIGILLAGVAGYQIASWRHAGLQSDREVQLEGELSLVLTALVDIADHRSRGEDDLAEWKLAALHGGFEGYLRGGGPNPTQFIPNIVEQTVVPEQELEPEEDEEEQD